MLAATNLGERKKQDVYKREYLDLICFAFAEIKWENQIDMVLLACLAHRKEGKRKKKFAAGVEHVVVNPYQRGYATKLGFISCNPFM